MTLEPVTGPRDLRDVKRLAELEVVIEGGLASFMTVAEALLEGRAGGPDDGTPRKRTRKAAAA